MTIEKRGKLYRAIVQINGKIYRKSFETLKEAKLFERCPAIEESPFGITFSELISRYYEEVARHKKSARQQNHRVNIIKRSPLAQEKITNITTEILDKFFEDRLHTKTDNQPQKGFVTESTVKKDRELISATFNYAVRKKLLDSNPVLGTMRLKSSPPRERIATAEEIAMLCNLSGWYGGKSIPKNTTQRVICAFVFSTLTGMRLGEICTIERSWIHNKYITLPATVTKTARSRDVALSATAKALLNLVIPLGYEKIFNLTPLNASALFRKIRDRAGLRDEVDRHGNVIKQGLHFHDGRATFCTMAAKKLPPLTLARQLGHTDLKMTMRYYRESADCIADMLD